MCVAAEFHVLRILCRISQLYLCELFFFPRSHIIKIVVSLSITEASKVKKVHHTPNVA